MRRPALRGLASIGIVACVVVLAIAQLAPRLLPQPAPSPAASPNPPATVARSTDFDTGWKFVLVNPADTTDPSGKYGNSSAPHAAAVSFDDSSWRSVTLPHDWSIELAPQASGVSNATGYFQGGLGWYRKTFTLPPSMAGKRISLEFDGVYMDSYEYLNGKLLGNHPYGYTGFNMDVTSLAHTDGVTPNVLAVVVQNKLPSSRWYSGSGITRNVSLVVTDPVHVARYGIFATTPNLETTLRSGFAEVHAAVDAVDEGGSNAKVDISARIVDAGGAVVAKAASSGVALSRTARTAGLDIRVDRPHLWSTSDPYLYTLVTDLVRGGTVVDTYATTFGIRWLRFDPAQGLLLNGVPMKLQGVDLHNDQGALGSVDNYYALLRQMTILKGMGVNSVRTSHNPPSREWIQVCDRLGIVMMVEAFDSWSQGKSTYDYGRFFAKWGDADIKEMVYEARNSPAVAMWSIGNEIPGFTSAAGVKTARQLIDDIHSLDTSRPIVAGSDRYRSVPATGSAADQILLELDGLGLNYESAQALDELHAKYPTKFFFESESSSEESTRGVYQDPQDANTGENYTPGRRATSSYDNNLASWTMSGEYSLKIDRDRPFNTGQYLWSGFDYIGEPTPYDVFPVKASFFGAVDTAGIPKDAYYLFQSQWTSAPMVHLLPMNWTDYRPGQHVQVWVYSNVDSVQLTLNGVSLGTKTFDLKKTADGHSYLETTEPSLDDKSSATGSYTSPNGSSGKLHLTWDVPFEPGKLVAVAMKNGAEVARDEIDTAGMPQALRLSPDKAVVANDGRSLSYVTVDVVDADGVVVPSADNLVDLSVSGGILAGADNGRQESAEGYKQHSHTAFNGKLVAIVQSTSSPGPIKVTARSTGLLPATTTVYASGEAGASLVAFAPAYVRSLLGAPVALPATVQAVHADGTREAAAVTWSSLPDASRSLAGTYNVAGSVAGSKVQAEAVVTVYSVAGLETYSTAVATGIVPRLPGTVRLAYSDGVEAQVAVKWDAVDPSRYAKAGLVSLTGTVAETPMKAVASVRVVDPSGGRGNIARSGSPLQPAADASFSGMPDTVPGAMLDGVTSEGGWSNAYVKEPTAMLPAFSRAHATEWVSVSWPGPQTFDSVRAYFVADQSHVLPSRIAVSVWDGAAWAPAGNANIAPAATSGGPTTVTFDRVTSSAVRLDLTSPAPGTDAGFLQIAELEVMGIPVTYNATASLASLEVNGAPVSGFDPTGLEYQVTVGPGIPQVAAVPADNGRVLVIPPASLPGPVEIIVTSEDGLSARTYLVNLSSSS